MPDGDLGGRTPSAADGQLVESSNDNNSPDALAPDGDGKEASLDDIFGELGGETPSQTPAASNDDLAVKVDRNTPTQTDDEEETVVNDKTGKTKDNQQQVTTDKNKVQGQQTQQQTPTIEGESEADKKARLARDYTGYKPEDAERLRKLPNAIFSHVSREIKARYNTEKELGLVRNELAELKKNPNRVPDNWYEHERAVELTPEYQQLSEQYTQAEALSNHWTQALIAIENKQPFMGIGQDGRPIGPYPPTPENKIIVSQALNQAQSQMGSLNIKAEQLAAQFKQQHGAINTYYEGEQTTQMFNKLRNDFKPANEEVEIFTNVVHPSHRNHPLAKLGGKMFSVLLRQARYIKKLEGEKTTQQLNNQDQRQAGPGKTAAIAAARGNGKNQPKEIDFDDLEAEMKGE